MKEITSKKTGKVQIVSDDEWNWIVGQGWTKKYTVKDMPAKPIKPPVIIPKEVLTKTNKSGKNN